MFYVFRICDDFDLFSDYKSQVYFEESFPSHYTYFVCYIHWLQPIWHVIYTWCVCVCLSIFQIFFSIVCLRDPRYLSRYRDCSQDERSGDRNPVRGEIFPTRPDRLRSPSSLLLRGYRVFPGVKRPGCGINHSPSTCAHVKERVGLLKCEIYFYPLYFYSTFFLLSFFCVLNFLLSILDDAFEMYEIFMILVKNCE